VFFTKKSVFTEIIYKNIDCIEMEMLLYVIETIREKEEKK